VAFFVAYRRWDCTRNAVLMAARAILLFVDYVRLRRVPAMHTLVRSSSSVRHRHTDSATICASPVEPTVFFWLASIAFLGSHWIGKQTLTQRLLSAALGNEEIRVAGIDLETLESSVGVFYALLGALNLLVRSISASTLVISKSWACRS